ncbi:MAG: hypothetical protein ACFCU4_04435 [Puniceicoccaceae bacterium]
MDLDQQAREEVGQTEFWSASKWLLLVGFVLPLIGFPVADFIARADRGETVGEFFDEVFDIGAAWWRPVAGRGGERGGFFARNDASLREIKDFESWVNQTNILREQLVSAYQGILYKVFQTGTIQVMVGKAGWLYFADDSRYVTARRNEAAFASAAEEIVSFHGELRSRGIDLLVVPVPVKQVVEAGNLSRRIPADHPALHPPAFGQWQRTVLAAGVSVLDPTPWMLAARDRGETVFLRADTHWRPETVQGVAKEVVAALLGNGFEPGDSEPEVGRLAVSNRGDLWDLLETESHYAGVGPETILLDRLRVPLVGEPEVLVLGDSFVNIYATENLKWGTRAGFAEQLERLIKVPVRRIAFNGDGINAPRKELARLQASGELDLSKVRAVVWVFAVRDLALKDWERIGFGHGKF